MKKSKIALLLSAFLLTESIGFPVNAYATEGPANSQVTEISANAYAAEGPANSQVTEVTENAYAVASAEQELATTAHKEDIEKESEAVTESAETEIIEKAPATVQGKTEENTGGNTVSDTIGAATTGADATTGTSDSDENPAEDPEMDPQEELGIFWNVKTDGTCEIRFKDNVMVPDLRFAVWSVEDGQDDLTWNNATAVDGKNTEYACAFKIENLKHFGKINIHAYTGASTCVGKLIVDIGTPAVTALTIADFDENAGSCTLVIGGLQHPELIKEIVVPVWSGAKQEDIVWYKASKQTGKTLEDIVYKVPVSIAKHNYNLGTYQMHVYMTDTTGKQTFQMKDTVTFETKGRPVVTATDNAVAYKAEVADLVAPAGYSKLEFAVWSRENGQDDLKWIQASKGSAIININEFKHLGEFNVHCYVTLKDGSRKLLGVTAFTPEVQPVSISLGESQDGALYPVIVKNVFLQNGISQIRVAVWSDKDGQDDLIWYTAELQADGSFKAMADIKKHKTPGQYHVHVYARTTSGKMQYLGNTNDLYVKEPSEVPVTIKDVDYGQASFTVTVSFPKEDAKTVASVYVPVWCAADQSDILWYKAKKVADGQYQVLVKAANHKNHTGIYQVHVYGNYNNGLSACIAKTSQDLRQDEISVTSGVSGKKVVVYRGSRYAKSVSIPVWSEDNGQDDLVWYTATKNNRGYWQITVDPTKHRNAGQYQVHVYADGTFVANTSFTMQYAEVKTEFTEIAGKMKVAASNQQLILVAASGTDAQVAMLNKNSDGTWYQVLVTNGYVGINGVGPTTEWNRKTPPGVFGFTQAFGIKPDPGTAFNYVQVDSTYYWVDDVNSKYYNKFVTTRKVKQDWTSAEHLIDYTGSYGYCLAIDYNPECTPGVGSAIFLHCSSGRPTAGCVSVPEAVMKKIMQEVRTDCKIVIDSKSGLASY